METKISSEMKVKELAPSKQRNNNPYPTELIYLNFQPLEVVSGYPQPQVL